MHARANGRASLPDRGERDRRTARRDPDRNRARSRAKRGARARTSTGVVNVLVLQHIACEPPGVYEDVLRERGAAIERVQLDEGDSLPRWQGFDAVIAMGGPMGATDDNELSWLTEEKRYVGEAVRAGVPFWGICLGAQLLAASLGAKVYLGPATEVGVLPVNTVQRAECLSQRRHTFIIRKKLPGKFRRRRKRIIRFHRSQGTGEAWELATIEGN